MQYTASSYAQPLARVFEGLGYTAVVEMGIFTGDCVRRAAERGVPRVSLACMIGKLSKKELKAEEAARARKG